MVPPSWERAVNPAVHAVVSGRGSAETLVMDIDMAELLRLEHAGWTSLCEGSAGEFYGGIMTEDALMVLLDGSVLDREQVEASLQDAPAWSAYEITDERLVEMGSDAAAFVYRGRAFRASGGPPIDARMSSVYVRRDGRWRLALYQQTPVPDEESVEL